MPLSAILVAHRWLNSPITGYCKSGVEYLAGLFALCFLRQGAGRLPGFRCTPGTNDLRNTARKGSFQIHDGAMEMPEHISGVKLRKCFRRCGELEQPEWMGLPHAHMAGRRMVPRRRFERPT